MSEAVEAKKEARNWSQARTLYVILQGEFVLATQPGGTDKDDTLRVLAPSIDGHVYKAGPWLTDWKNAPEVPKNYKLSLKHAHGDRKHQGAHCFTSHPENRTDMILNMGKKTGTGKLDAGGARLDLTLPMPVAILPGALEPTQGVVTITITKPDGTTVVVPTAPVPTLMPILVYKWYEPHIPYLFAAESEDVWMSGGPGNGYQSIHLFATSEDASTESPAHAKMAFHEAVKLLGVNAQINWPPRQFSQVPVTPPPGLSYAQVNFFLPEIEQFAPSDPQLIVDDWDWNDPEMNKPLGGKVVFVGGDSGNCGPATGGGDGGDNGGGDDGH